MIEDAEVLVEVLQQVLVGHLLHPKVAGVLFDPLGDFGVSSSVLEVVESQQRAADTDLHVVGNRVSKRPKRRGVSRGITAGDVGGLPIFVSRFR